MPRRLIEIATQLHPFAPDTPVQAALQRFTSEPGVESVPAALEDGGWALVRRADLFEAFLRAGGAPALRAQPVSAFARLGAAVFDPATPVAVAAAQARKQLAGGLVLANDAAYAGFVPACALLTALAEENVSRAKALKAARGRLEDARRAQDEALAMVGHELRTPLTGVLGLADLLRESRLPGPAKTYARAISQSGAHLKRVLDDLLDASRLEAGKLALAPRPFDLRVFAGDIERFWGAAAQAAGLSLRVEIPRWAIRRVEADEVRLRQIVDNLISNALKHAGQGDIEVRLETEASGGALSLELTVADGGPGVDTADKAGLFEAFERASGDASTQGSGLGLPIARRLARAMSGDIQLEDNAGGGCRFIARLPVQRAGPRLAVENPEAPRRRAFELGRLLVVEDHDVTRFVIAQSLTAAGWQVDAVRTAHQGERRAEAVAYQAVLSDLRLPDMAGEELARALRFGGGPSMRAALLAVTADLRPERLREARNAGFDAVVEKPVRPRDLVTKLADAILNAQDRPPARLNTAARIGDVALPSAG